MRAAGVTWRQHLVLVCREGNEGGVEGGGRERGGTLGHDEGEVAVGSSPDAAEESRCIAKRGVRREGEPEYAAEAFHDEDVVLVPAAAALRMKAA